MRIRVQWLWLMSLHKIENIFLMDARVKHIFSKICFVCRVVLVAILTSSCIVAHVNVAMKLSLKASNEIDNIFFVCLSGPMHATLALWATVVAHILHDTCKHQQGYIESNMTRFNTVSFVVHTTKHWNEEMNIFLVILNEHLPKFRWHVITVMVS
jgi:hypothetical protein